MKNKQSLPALLSAIVVLLMIFIDSSGSFTYFSRSFIKVTLMGILPLSYLYIKGKALPNLRKDQYFKYIVILMIVIIFVIIGGAWILNQFAFLDQVKDSLARQVGVNAGNYPWVFLYIVLINGPLEEIFFRHVLLQLKIPYKNIFSSFLFAVYHVGMMFTMFPWFIFALGILGLMAVGYFFIRINTEVNSILNSVLIHMAANLAINTVGYFLIMRP